MSDPVTDDQFVNRKSSPDDLQPGIVGQLRRVGDHYEDDHGPVNPVFCHSGDAFSQFVRDPAKVRAQFQRIKAVGYHGVRSWSVLSGRGWEGKEVAPSVTPDYWGQVREFITMARECGLVLHWGQGDLTSISDRRGFAIDMAVNVNHAGANTIALFEGLNEARDTGEPDVNKVAAMVQAFTNSCSGPLVALSAYTGHEDVALIDEWSIPPAQVYLVHSYRAGHWYDKVRHIFSLPFEGQPRLKTGWQSEPAGPGEEVSAIENRHELEDRTLGPARLSAMALVALMTKQAWVYMSGAGVWMNHPIDQETGFAEVPKACASLPRDVMTYQRTFDGGTRCERERVFAAWPMSGDAWVRCEHAMHDDGRFVCLIYGPADVRGARPVKPVTVTLDVVLSPEVRLVVGRI